MIEYINYMKSSFIYKMLHTLYTFVSELFFDSIVYRGTSRLLVKFTKKFKESYIYFAISNVYGSLDSLFKESAIYNLFEMFLLIPFIILSKTIGFSSFIKKTLVFIKSKMHFVIGIMVVLISIIPDIKWNNIYLVLIMLVILFIYLQGININSIKSDMKSIHSSMYFFMIIVFFAMITSFVPSTSIKSTLFLFSSIIVSILISISIKSFKELKTIAFFVLLAAFLMGLYGFYSKYVGINIYISGNEDSSAGIRVGRMFSTMGNPNNFAEYLILAIPTSFAYILTVNDWRKKIVLLSMLFIPTLALVLSYSRSAWVGLFISLIVFFILYDWRFFPFIIILAFAMLPFLPYTIIARIKSIINFSSDSSFSHRENIWQGARAMLSVHWFNGVGIGPEAFSGIYSTFAKWTINPKYQFAREMKDFIYTNAVHSHNLFLEIWLEMGVFGIISFLILIFKNLFNGIYAIINTNSRDYKLFLSAFIGTLVGILFMGMVEYIWFYPRILLFFWIIIGMFVSMINIVIKEEICR